MKTVAFVPIKMNNERLPGKNVKAFTNGEPLITYILNTLKQTTEIDEIYVYCSSEEIIEYLPEGVNYLNRDIYFDLNTTSFNEVLISFAKLVKSDIYVLAHATGPFISSQSIDKGVSKIKNDDYDSALAVTELREFIWRDNYPMNYNLSNIPRTQDLEPYYVETCGLFVYTRDLIINKKRRIGDKPYLVKVSKIEAIDINTAQDFEIADAVFQMLKEKL